MKIKRLLPDEPGRQNSIISALNVCSSNLWNQAVNTPESLSRLSEKFNKHAEFLIAENDNGECVGCAAYYRNDVRSKIAFLSIIVVRSGFESLGIGTNLIKSLELDCMNNGFCTVRLEVARQNEKAISFYKRNGYGMSCERTAGSLFLVKTLSGEVK